MSNRQNRPFYQNLLYLFSVLMALGAVGLIILWVFLIRFDESTSFLRDDVAPSTVESAIPGAPSISAVILSPAGADVTADGDSLDVPVDYPETPELFAGVTDETQKELLPTAVRYETKVAEDYYVDAEIDGEACEVLTDIQSGVHYVSRPIGEREREEMEKALTKTAKTYARYISRDASLNELSQLICPKTEFYDRIRKFDNQWFSDHDSYAFNDFTIEGVQSFSKNDFTGVVSFEYEIKSGSVVEHTPCIYQLSFLKLNGQWRLADMKISQ